MQERLKELDFIRCIATIAVLLIHVTSTYILDNDITYVINQSMRFAIPVFIILSGASIYYSNLNKDNISYFNFIKKRVIKIFVPYMLWTIIYIFYEVRHDLGIVSTGELVKQFLKYLVLGKEHLYFVVIIFQIYLIYPLFHLLFKKGYSNITLIITFCVSLYLQLGVYLIRWSIYIIPKPGSTYFYLLFPSWIFFFILGMYIIQKKSEFESLFSPKLLALAIIWLMSLFVLTTDTKLSTTYGSSIKPTVMFYGIISFIFFYIFFLNIKKVSPEIMNVVMWFSNQSYGIYLSHILILKLIRSYTNMVGFGNIWSLTGSVPVLFITLTISTCVFIYLFSFLSFSNMFGVQHTPKFKEEIFKIEKGM